MTKKEHKTRFAQQYSLSEEDIDDSLIPIFISLNSVENRQKRQSEEQSKSIEIALAEQRESCEELTKKVKGSIKTHSYANYPKMPQIK